MNRVSCFCAPQECIAEKDHIKVQFQHVAQQKSAVDEANRALLLQLNEVKKMISEYDDQRNAIVVRCLVTCGACAMLTRPTAKN